MTSRWHFHLVVAATRHELRDVDGLRSLALERFQLVVADAHVLVLDELIALHEMGALHELDDDP